MTSSVLSLSAIGFLTICILAAPADGQGACPRTAALLQAGQETVRIVAFGDSITGVYYHTGGRRAWCAMLGLALERVYPNAKLRTINAGISGNTSGAGLNRMQTDVLDHKPHLVAVMFGMNDVVGVPAQQFHDNIVQIVRRSQDAGAEVVLMTPNSIYPEDPGRPVARLEEFAEIVRRVGAELDVPVADCYRAYEDVRATDRRAWMLLMSETIHPAMNGHKLFAEEVARVISGKSVSLADVPAPFPSLLRTPELLAKGEPVKVIAMEPYDSMIEDALREINPNARAVVTSWTVPHRSLAKIEEWSKGVRDQKPDLVIVAVPAAANAPSEERFIRSYEWVLNWSLSFGLQEWDCVAILPSVLRPHLSVAERKREELAREIIWTQHIGMIQRQPGDESPAAAVLGRWLRSQVETGTND